jgi:ABC-type transport system substrate-binding protein
MKEQNYPFIWDAKTTRRGLLKLMGAGLSYAAASAVLAACGAEATSTPVPTSTKLPVPPTYTPFVAEATLAPTDTAAPATGANVTTLGRELPPDAAPLDKQVFRMFTATGTTVDFFVSVYNRPAPNCMLQLGLVYMDKNFQLQPQAAKSWEVSPDGLTWTFHLQEGIKWDRYDTDLTADDFVHTYQFGADPEHAWDFTWYLSGVIKNWDECVAGELPLEELGVKKGDDDYTLLITTEQPTPYLPGMTLFSDPLCKRAMEESGEYYNNDPETSATCSPWKLEEWAKDERLVYVQNPKYTGPEIRKPWLERIESYIVDFGAVDAVAAYQKGEMDYMDISLQAGAYEMVEADPELQNEFCVGFGDFRTDYLGFNTYAPPFDNLKVRQAFSHSVDRDQLVESVIRRRGWPAYAFLMPGFPGSNEDELKDIQKYDPELAKTLMEQAGYPGGDGFPKLELWLRQEDPFVESIAEAIAAMLQTNLGINVEISNKEMKLFMDALNAHELPFYMVSYGMDFLDPANMMGGLFHSRGRHAWKNEEFDRLADEAGPLVGDPELREEMYHEQERILLEDVGIIPIWHRTPGYLHKPYIKGPSLEADDVGVACAHWPVVEMKSDYFDNLYITQDVG